MMQIPIESMNLIMLNVGRARHNADWNWKNVSSPFTRIFYVEEGEALLHLPEKSVALKSGRLYIVPAYTVHSYECHGLFDHYYLHVYEGYKKEMNLQDVYDLPTEVTPDNHIDMLFSYMCERQPEARLPQSDPKSYDTSAQTSDYMQRYRDMPFGEKMEMRGAMLMIMSHFMRHAVPRVWTHDERMKRVLEHIHSHLDNDVDLDELADVACITKPYLIRLFKREFGTSPIQYINRKKVERAQLLLFTSNMAVKEVAYTLGYNDHSYFIRLFHKLTGLTPLEYRTRLKG